MPNFLDPMWYFAPKRMLRINAFIWKWVMRFLTASAEVALHRNFGRRYLPRLLAGVFFCTVCASLAPRPSPLTGVWVLGLYALVTYHAIHAYTRRGVAEPHSLSAGEPWPVWRKLPFAETTVQRYCEPAFCLAVGCFLRPLDPFLGTWLLASGVAVLVKGQLTRVQETRRVLDAMDARHEAQALHAALNARQQRPQAQQAHRARLP
ncbi:MAG: hypothetical protein KGS61_05195 [Verrucomicrobia bacterium]|nr:hypothetical protein [Verrucomicrobiota bacterium]